MKIVKKLILYVLSFLLVISSASVYTVFAEGAQPLPYLCDEEGNDVLTDKTMKNVYWIDLEKRTVKDGIDSELYYGLFPKYLTSHDETTVSDIAFNSLGGFNGLENAGIVDSENTYWMLPGLQYRYGYLAGNDTAEGDTEAGKHPDKPIENRVNPFGFKENDLLSQEEIKKPLSNLQIYGDLKITGSENSKSIGQFSPGSKLSLDFSLDTSWFKRYLNSWTLNYTRVGGLKDDEITKFRNSFGKVDAGIVYTLDIPDGVELAKNISAKVSGLSGFSVSVRKSENGKTLIITLKKDNAGTVQKWEDILKSVNKTDTGNIKITVSGLSVKESVADDQEIRIRGTASGFYDFVNSYTKNFINPAPVDDEDDRDNANDRANRQYLFFAAQQSKDGLDEGGEADKQKQISYTFRVNKPANNTVTFINGSKTHAKVKVENGKSIDKDALTDQSMPKDPVKSGYKFKEWNTEKDGTGAKFTGSTVVNEDMTVYAIYTGDGNKKPAPSKPDTGDRTNLPLYVALLGLSAVSLAVAGLRKRRKEN